MATEDDRYRQSTQYRLWSFSRAQLAQTREKTNELARSNISERLTQLASLQQPSSTSQTSTGGAPSRTLSPSANDGVPTPIPADQPQPTPNNGTTFTLPEFLSPAEELQLLNIYTVELIRAAKFCELPEEIRATAAVFLRRFYVTNSIMTYPPTDMLKTALFFGSKAEGNYVRLGKFADNFPNTTSAEILAGEFLLCQGIRFAFDVRHPFRALEGAIMELRGYGDISTSKIDQAHIRAREILKFSPLVTDAYFHYTPSQIMLAALSIADGELAERVITESFRDVLGHKIGNGHATDDADAPAELRRRQVAELKGKVIETVESCKAMLATELPERLDGFWSSPEARNLMRPLARKLKKCRDPDRSDLVALQRAKREQAMAKGRKGSDGDIDMAGAPGSALGEAIPTREAKRRKMEDPFGGAL